MRAKYMSSFGAIFISVQKLAIFTWKQQRFFLDRTFVISFPLFQHLWKGKNNCGNSSTNSCWPTIFEARLRIWQIQFQNYISCQCSDPNFELDPKASTQVTPSLVKPRNQEEKKFLCPLRLFRLLSTQVRLVSGCMERAWERRCSGWWWWWWRGGGGGGRGGGEEEEGEVEDDGEVENEDRGGISQIIQSHSSHPSQPSQPILWCIHPKV